MKGSSHSLIPHSKMKILLLDTETTDIDGHIVEVAWKAYSDTECDDERILLVRPPEPIGYGAMATHHITNEDVAECPPIEEAVKETKLEKLLQERIMIAHNAQFDVKALKKAGLEPKHVICTYKVAYQLFPDSESHALQYLRYSLGLKCPSPRDPTDSSAMIAHSAMGDVVVLEQLFARMLGVMSKDKPIKDCIADMVNISAKPLLLRKLTFGKHKGMSFTEVPRDYLVWLSGTFGKDKDKTDDENLVYTVNYYLKSQT